MHAGAQQLRERQSGAPLCGGFSKTWRPGGCDHYLQEYELQGFQDEIRKIERELKGRFHALTEEIIRTHSIKVVGEECKPGQDTVPRRLSAELGCEYAEIDMNSEDREKHGIPKNYEKLGDDQQRRCNALREEFMVERTYSESTVETAKLIVCGALHMEALAQRFREREPQVIVRNVLNEKWWDPPWEKMMRGEI